MSVYWYICPSISSYSLGSDLYLPLFLFCLPFFPEVNPKEEQEYKEACKEAREPC